MIIANPMDGDAVSATGGAIIRIVGDFVVERSIGSVICAEGGIEGMVDLDPDLESDLLAEGVKEELALAVLDRERLWCLIAEFVCERVSCEDFEIELLAVFEGLVDIGADIEALAVLDSDFEGKNVLDGLAVAECDSEELTEVLGINEALRVLDMLLVMEILLVTDPERD